MIGTSLRKKIIKDIKQLADSRQLYTTYDIFLILEKYYSKERILKELGISEFSYSEYKKYKEMKNVDRAILDYFEWRLNYGNE